MLTVLPLRRRNRAAYNAGSAAAFTAGMIYQQLINGLMLGASYALVAIGYTLIFGVLNLLYFAHGEIFMVGAFVGLFLVVYAGLGIYGALLGAMVACAVARRRSRSSSRSARCRRTARSRR